MAKTNYEQLLTAVAERQQRMQDFMFSDAQRIAFDHAHLDDAIYSYPKAGGKSLRPAVMMFACGAVGGDENDALPAAAAIELFHTWTLVHDDIIDKDDKRRGKPTVHVEFADRAQKELGYDPATAAHYGLSLAILAGDMQQGWSAALLSSLSDHADVPPLLTLRLVNELFRRVEMTLLKGETLDIIYSQTPVEKLDDQKVLDMLWQKTGILYEFAGRAGAAIGLRETDIYAEAVQRLATFTGHCGTAFQIQDDVLGVVGEEKQLGKPVGSDIREGKRTLIVLESLRHMSAAERDFTLKILGNAEATREDIRELINLMGQRGGIDHAKTLAQNYIREAVSAIDSLPDTDYKRWLLAWADYMIEREF